MDRRDKSFKKYHTTIALIFIMFSISTLALFAEEWPLIEALDTPWDFGRIKRGEVAEKSFYITNRGDETLNIKGVRSCCGYSMLELSSWTIEPGETAEITISSDTKLKYPGPDKNYFTLKSDDPENPNLNVSITAYIVE
jgi:hypothetical protein